VSDGKEADVAYFKVVIHDEGVRKTSQQHTL